jgi:hypothetical protein
MDRRRLPNGGNVGCARCEGTGACWNRRVLDLIYGPWPGKCLQVLDKGYTLDLEASYVLAYLRVARNAPPSPRGNNASH